MKTVTKIQMVVYEIAPSEIISSHLCVIVISSHPFERKKDMFICLKTCVTFLLFQKTKAIYHK